MSAPSQEGGTTAAAIQLTKPLFVYLKGMRVPLKELRDAGYVPLAVDDLDGYRIIGPMFQVDSDLLKQCAYETLMSDDFPSKEKFAKRVLRVLVKQSQQGEK